MARSGPEPSPQRQRTQAGYAASFEQKTAAQGTCCVYQPRSGRRIPIFKRNRTHTGARLGRLSHARGYQYSMCYVSAAVILQVRSTARDLTECGQISSTVDYHAHRHVARYRPMRQLQVDGIHGYRSRCTRPVVRWRPRVDPIVHVHAAFGTRVCVGMVESCNGHGACRSRYPGS